MPYSLPHGHPHWVPGDGPRPARLAFVGEAPSTEEMRQGVPFVGPAGQVNWWAAGRYAGLERAGAYVTNWRKIPFASDKEKKAMTPDERMAWTTLLDQELADRAPNTIAALGALAVSALLGPGYSLDWCNGLPIDRGDFVVVPIVHPAAGIHQPDLLQGTVAGYQGLAAYLRGEVRPRPWKQSAPPPFTLKDIPQDADAFDFCAIDTEGTAREPVCLTWAVRAGTGRIIYADDKYRLHQFRTLLHDWHPTLILHNACHDAAVLRTLGIDIWRYPVIDTMVSAFVLQDLPRGLKPLTRRLLDVEMPDYVAVVGPYLDAEMAKWRARAAARAYELITFEQQFTPRGKPRLAGGQPVYKKAGPPLALSLAQHAERDQNFSLQEEQWAEAQVGPAPRMETALRLVPREVAEDYAGRDAACTWGIRGELQARITAAGLDAVHDLDQSVLPLIDDMQAAGLHLNVEKYWDVLSEVSLAKEDCLNILREVTGIPDFNPNSGDQVAAYCDSVFAQTGKLELKKLTKSKTRKSTDDRALSQLRADHPVPGLVLRARKLQKYETTYLRPIEHLVREIAPGERRIFVRLRPTSVVSGRFSSGGTNDEGDKTFNALAVPSHDALGLRIRGIFDAPPGRKLMSWDFSQIELRIFAALAKEPVLTEVFVKGTDPHTNLAAKLFGKPYDRVDKLTERTPSKTIHYLLVYGGGGDTLYEELRSMGITRFDRNECFRLIDDTWRLYRRGKEFLQDAATEARRYGYVSDYLGRRRFLPATQLLGDRWPQKNMRLEAERQAGNFKMQAMAAELIKGAMRRVWTEVYPELRRRGIFFRLWLQVHDELMGEGQEGAFAEINELMVRAMTAESGLLAPIKIEVDGTEGADWGALKG